ncbi:hypothetical protein D088_820072 [Salmonella enterica subsp. houtenae serovar 16:z4,z32:-- str. RKS3027]|nr:hypothetical protein D088_820072 [Salmonella enterica subsp. houtenae serovar 16:z4,z32:-- str. RKS3027]
MFLYWSPEIWHNGRKKLAIHGELLTLLSDLMMQHFVNDLIRL